MDYMTLFGMICGLGAVGFELHHSEMFGIIFNVNAISLIYGGTIGSVCMSYPWSIVRNVPRGFYWVLFPPKVPEPQEMIETLVELCRRVQQEGAESLQGFRGKVSHPFLDEAIRLMVSGLEPEVINEKLEEDTSLTHQRHMRLAALFNSAGTYSPIFGLLGTLIGVVTVLRNISDPSQMGSSMALAMTASFYGIFSANFLFLPVAVKLRFLAEQETLARELISHGVRSALNGDVPMVAAKKLENFLNHEMRKQQKRAARAEAIA